MTILKTDKSPHRKHRTHRSKRNRYIKKPSEMLAPRFYTKRKWHYPAFIDEMKGADRLLRENGFV